MSGKSLETIIIRDATREDIEALCRLEETIFSSNKLKKRQFIWLIEHGNAYCIVGENPQKQLVGYAISLYRKNSRMCRVYGFGLIDEVRGTGIATNLMQHLYTHAISSGCTTMSLEVRLDNIRATRFYLKEGFHLHRYLVHYYEDAMAGVRLHKELFGTHL